MPTWTPERRTVVIFDNLTTAVSHIEQLMREAPWAMGVLKRLHKQAEIAAQIAGRDLTREMSLPSVRTAGPTLNRSDYRLGPFKIPSQRIPGRGNPSLVLYAEDDDAEGVWFLSFSGSVHVNSENAVYDLAQRIDEFLDSLTRKLRTTRKASLRGRVAERHLTKVSRLPDPDDISPEKAEALLSDISQRVGETAMEYVRDAKIEIREQTEYIRNLERAWERWDWRALEDLNLISREERKWIAEIQSIWEL